MEVKVSNLVKSIKDLKALVSTVVPINESLPRLYQTIEDGDKAPQWIEAIIMPSKGKNSTRSHYLAPSAKMRKAGYSSNFLDVSSDLFDVIPTTGDTAPVIEPDGSVLVYVLLEQQEAIALDEDLVEASYGETNPKAVSNWKKVKSIPDGTRAIVTAIQYQKEE